MTAEQNQIDYLTARVEALEKEVERLKSLVNAQS